MTKEKVEISEADINSKHEIKHFKNHNWFFKKISKLHKLLRVIKKNNENTIHHIKK